MIPVIQTIELTKRYGAHQALHTLDLDVAPGAVFGLIGPNGAGKTTTLRILLDIIRPTSGSVRILGTTPGEGGPALRRRIGYIPGELRLEGRLRGRQLLRHLAEISGPVPPGTIDHLADRLGVDLGRQVRTLSKGNKQKLGLIQAFMHHPELLVLDEPTSGLDPLVQRTFLEMVREARDAGQTVLLSSHVLSEIQQTADEVAVLSGGRIVAQGRVDSLRLSSIRHVRAGVDGTSLALLRQDLEKLPGLSDVTVTGNGGGVARLAAKVDGGIDPFVKLLARHRVVDLTVEEPDLEESVLQLYGSGGVEEATHV
ncbi:ABC transporter ATP-binding protein [Arthrobacter antioxidans]|uniref:ABC transporter ATP-binding protein n=1 Tax=Arthrobacter antioxidans TaxID=2895818 RepID=UPI001FFFEBA3|nr:ABC transporter ATP-binding protein [Arthrobacter antioxidans]